MNVESLIREVLMLEEDVVLKDETTPDEITSWDSLGHINIISAIEDECDIEIEPEEIGDIQSVGDIKRLLSGKGIIFD